MTKIKYPKNGLYSSCSVKLDECITDLNSAINSTDYTIPSNFAYKTYMTDLKTTLTSYKTEMSAIKTCINSISNKYEDLEVDLTAKAKLLGNIKVNLRNRLIK